LRAECERSHFLALLIHLLLGKENGRGGLVALAIGIIDGVDAGDGGTPIEHYLVGIAAVIAGAYVSGDAVLAAEVQGDLPGVGRLLDHLRGGYRFKGDNVVVDHDVEVAGSRLAIDESPRFQGAFLGVGVPLYNDAVILIPFCGLGVRVVVEDV